MMCRPATGGATEKDPAASVPQKGHGERAEPSEDRCRADDAPHLNTTISAMWSGTQEKLGRKPQE